MKKKDIQKLIKLQKFLERKGFVTDQEQKALNHKYKNDNKGNK